MAEELGWTLAELEQALDEVETLGLAIMDRSARVVWLPNGLKHNLPGSPNVVLSWREELKLIPECELKQRAIGSASTVLVSYGRSYAVAFAKILAKPSGMPSDKACDKTADKGCGNQDQKQKQKQNQESQNPARAPEASRPTQSPAAGLAAAMRKAGCPDADEFHRGIQDAIVDGLPGEELIALLDTAKGRGKSAAYVLATVRGRRAAVPSATPNRPAADQPGPPPKAQRVDPLRAPEDHETADRKMREHLHSMHLESPDRVNRTVVST